MTVDEAIEKHGAMAVFEADIVGGLGNHASGVDRTVADTMKDTYRLSCAD